MRKLVEIDGLEPPMQESNSCALPLGYISIFRLFILYHYFLSLSTVTATATIITIVDTIPHIYPSQKIILSPPYQ